MSTDFAHFATNSVEAAVEVLRQHRLTDGLTTLQATGGGAHKYRKTFEQRLGVGLVPGNELDAVVLGMCLMVKAVPDECYTFERVADPAAAESSASEPAQPVTIPSESLGISHPLRKIHKPFCARQPLAASRHARPRGPPPTAADLTAVVACVAHAHPRVVSPCLASQPMPAKTSFSLSSCATLARASRSCMSNPRPITRACLALPSEVAPFLA